MRRPPTLQLLLLLLATTAVSAMEMGIQDRCMEIWKTCSHMKPAWMELVLVLALMLGLLLLLMPGRQQQQKQQRSVASRQLIQMLPTAVHLMMTMPAVNMIILTAVTVVAAAIVMPVTAKATAAVKVAAAVKVVATVTVTAMQI
jgi:hypothetical protein